LRALAGVLADKVLIVNDENGCDFSFCAGHGLFPGGVSISFSPIQPGQSHPSAAHGVPLPTLP
jgi:hypothetical protein